MHPVDEEAQKFLRILLVVPREGGYSARDCIFNRTGGHRLAARTPARSQQLKVGLCEASRPRVALSLKVVQKVVV